jgi:GTPase SAR1 family protein
MIPSNVRSSVAYSVHAKMNFRVIVVGDSAVGKTCLIVRYVKGTFNKNYTISLGVEFYSKMIEVKG